MKVSIIEYVAQAKSQAVIEHWESKGWELASISIDHGMVALYFSHEAKQK